MRFSRPSLRTVVLALGVLALSPADVTARTAQVAGAAAKFLAQTNVSLKRNRWFVNGELTYPGTRAEGLLMNVPMVNSVVEDRNKPDFDPDSNTSRFLACLPEYEAHGIAAFTI
jgi:hypothetical protein